MPPHSRLTRILASALILTTLLLVLTLIEEDANTHLTPKVAKGYMLDTFDTQGSHDMRIDAMPPKVAEG